MTEKLHYTHSFDADSSAMKKVYYASAEQKLVIEWDSFNYSVYDDISRTAYEEFKAAPSKGSFYHQRIYKSAKWIPGNNDVELVEAPRAISGNKVFTWDNELTFENETLNLLEGKKEQYYEITTRVLAGSLEELIPKLSGLNVVNIKAL